MAAANWTRMVSSVSREKAHTQTRKKRGLTRKKGPESEFDVDKEEDKPENDDYDEEEYAEEGGEAAERGGEAVARKSDNGDRPLPFRDTELRSLTADAREIPRALGDTFLVKAEARASRNVQEKPAGISIAPVDERSERRSPSGTNSHRFDSSPSPTSFRLLSHVLDIINIGKTWERIRSALTYSGNSQSMATVTP